MTGRIVHVAWPLTGFSVAYALSIIVGRATRVADAEISLVWPAAAVAVLWAIHARTLPRPLAAAHWALLAGLTFVVNLTTSAALDLAAWFVVVNVVLAAATSSFLGYDGRRVALHDPADLGRLAVAVALGTVLSASLAVLYFAYQGDSGLLSTFVLFAVRNGVTALVGVAVLLRLREITWQLPRPSTARLIEAIVCGCVSAVVFGRVFWFNPGYPIAFGIMLPAMWVALRFSTTTSTLFVSASGVLIVWATLLDRGALEGIAPQQQAVLAQAMVGSVGMVILALALFRDSRDDLIDRLRHLAEHDPLTGLANRALLTQRLDEALARPRRTDRSVGVVYLDLDGFKEVNDAWGHGEGDLLLGEMARRICTVVRPDDVVARIGGDEFVVACVGIAGEPELRELAERIRARVAEPYGAALDAPFDRITASVGVAISHRTSTAKALIAAADRAMYDAKGAGRNRVSPAQPGTAAMA